MNVIPVNKYTKTYKGETKTNGLSLASFRQMMEIGVTGIGKDGIEQEDAQETAASVTDTPVEVTG